MRAAGTWVDPVEDISEDESGEQTEPDEQTDEQPAQNGAGD